MVNTHDLHSEETQSSHRQTILLLILVALIAAAGYFFWQQVGYFAILEQVDEDSVTETEAEERFDFSTLPPGSLTIAYCEFVDDSVLQFAPGETLPWYFMDASGVIQFHNFAPRTFDLEFSYEPGFTFSVPAGEVQVVTPPDDINEFEILCNGEPIATAFRYR